MIHERDYSIPLAQQIENIRKTIEVDNKDDYPIDIMEGDLQIYRETMSGYWEKYTYDGDKKLLEYTDSTDIKKLSFPEFVALTAEERGKLLIDILKKDMDKKGKITRGMFIEPHLLEPHTLPWGELLPTMGVGCKPGILYNRDTINQTIKAKMVTKVFMVELNDTLYHDKTEYNLCSNEMFMEEARRQSGDNKLSLTHRNKHAYRIFTLPEFQLRCNKGEVSLTSALIRFIEIAEVISTDTSGSMK